MSDEALNTEIDTNPVVHEPVEETVVETKPKRKVKEDRQPQIRDHEDAILELRKENEKLRKSLEEVSEHKAKEMAEQRILEAKEEAKAEAQKILDERLREMDRQARNRVTKAELKAQATKAGVVDFDDLFAVMRGADALKNVQYSDDGEVLNAAEIVAEMKQKKPHLFTGVSTSSTASAPPAATRPAKPQKVALSMSYDEYEAAKQRLFSR